ncbi:MAG: ATP synthase F0 subunit B [Treponema sp.]|nr:ATP synthase F0 subunit B [Treponema sp.]
MIDLSISTFLITLINIGILFAVLRVALFKRVTKFMEDRANKIQHSIDEAEKDRQEAKALIRQYEDRLKDVQGETKAILEASREKARQEAAQIIEKAREGANSLIANAHKQIEAEQRAAMALFRAEAAALVIGASSRLLQRELTQEDSRRLAGLLLQEVGKQ